MTAGNVVSLCCQMTSAQSSKIPKKKRVVEFVNSGDRFSILREVLSFVPLGSRVIVDSPKVGPANVEKYGMQIRSPSIGRTHALRMCSCNGIQICLRNLLARK